MGSESPVQDERKLIGDTLAASGEWEVRRPARSLVPFMGISPPCSAATLPVPGSASPAVNYSPAPSSYTKHFHQAPSANPATEKIATSAEQNPKTMLGSLSFSFLSPPMCMNSDLAGNSWLAMKATVPVEIGASAFVVSSPQEEWNKREDAGG